MGRVYVRRYNRIQNGRDEQVIAHTRRFPKPQQMTFNFQRQQSSDASGPASAGPFHYAFMLIEIQPKNDSKFSYLFGIAYLVEGLLKIYN